MALQLVIGNKNYSSWSMRPWVLMTGLGIGFEEIRLRFDFADGSPFRQAVARYSPAGFVPVLVDDGFAVWDTLAITEYLHERFPGAGVWPSGLRERARARSLCAEMHSGFGALRSHCPMNIEASLPEVGARIWAEQEAVRRNVARLESIFAAALGASGGPFLFGAFGAADAFFAPVCMRLRSYALPLSEAAQAYVGRVAAAPGVRRWIDEALAEADFLDFEEPYRKGR
ncbi:MAG: glutathione S-transferase [Burkholderiales bacterium]|nr:glutathione S-transferase [Burkholderiales bacterium]MDE2395979.1 glutathione S-transferase [Burkholderiales bacterium]MDE2453084.1 glutathione S-transferase [Burkholderiales bacterium]